MAERKSAGLKPEPKVEGDFEEEELSDIDDLLGETLIEEDAVIESPVDAGSEKEDSNKDVETDSSESLYPETVKEQAEVSEPVESEALNQTLISTEPGTLETSETLGPIENPAAPTVPTAPEETIVGESLEAEIELPED